MKLYGYFRSSTTYRVRIALNLKGVDYEVAPVNLLSDEHRSDTFSALNPFETVPALVIGQHVYVQSMAIMVALDELYPSPALLPDDADLRQHCRELAFAIATEIHAPNNLSVLKYLKRELDIDEDARRGWYHHWVHNTFAPVEQRLSKAGLLSPLPFGDQPGLFECVLIPQVYNAQRFGVDMAAYPRIRTIDAYCTALPAFAKAHPDNQPDSLKG